MPKAAPRPCPWPGCKQLVGTGQSYCDVHKARKHQEQDAKRGNSHQRGYNSKWRAAREVFLRSNSLCVHCLANNQITASIEVDHIKPHKGDMALFWNQGNWQALCKPCHSRKTATEDSKFTKRGSKQGVYKSSA